jgi:hypothetical protein
LEFFEDAVESMLRAHKKKNVFAYIGISCKKKRIMECLQFQLLLFLQLEFFEDAVESMLRAHKKKNVFAYIGISCKKKESWSVAIPIVVFFTIGDDVPAKRKMNH